MMDVNSPSPIQKDVPSSEEISLLLAEYTNLREEILKRLEIRHQIISLALIAPGTIFAFGLQTQNTALILLYPFLALCLASSWAKNDYQGKLLGDYILNHIESKVGANNIGWQHYRKSASPGQFNLYFFGTRALFVGTELLAILLGISLGKLNGLTITLLIVAIISIFLTIIILINERDYSKGSFSRTDIEAYIKKLLKRP